MGSAFSRFDSSTHIVMLGLDSAGKSTALYQLKFDQYMHTLPTVGFNCERVRGRRGRARGAAFTVWDVGGQDKVRPLWRSYTRNTDGLVFVVDSGDGERLDEARLELHRAARANPGVPILVLANKQDLPAARPPDRLEALLSLSELSAAGGAHLWHVQAACAVTGEGLDEALEHLYGMVLKRRKSARRGRNTRR